MARNLLGSLFWHYDHPPPLTPITPVTPVFMSKGHGRGGGGKFFYQKIFSSRNDLIWRENWLAPWHHGWHHVGTMVGFLAPWSPPLVGRVGGGGGQQSFGQKIFSSRNGLKWRKSGCLTFCRGSRFNVATILGQFFLVFLVVLFNLRWAQLYVSLVL